MPNLSTLPLQPFGAHEAPRLLHSSVLYEETAREEARRCSADAAVRIAYYKPGYDARGRACFHVFCLPAWQIITLNNGDRVRRVYGEHTFTDAPLYREYGACPSCESPEIVDPDKDGDDHDFCCPRWHR